MAMKQRFMGKNRSEQDLGFMIPIEWWEAEDLSISEAILLTEIKRLSTDNGCLETNAYFAKFMGLSKSRISELINQLKAKGYVRNDYYTDSKAQFLVAAMIVALFFGMMHGDTSSWEYVLISLLLQVLYRHYGDLRVNMAAHVTFNLATLIALLVI